MEAGTPGGIPDIPRGTYVSDQRVNGIQKRVPLQTNVHGAPKYSAASQTLGKTQEVRG